MYKMAFSSIYPLYIKKLENKGRCKAELDEIICWLTGYDESGLVSQIEKQVDIETFFAEAPQINPKAEKITGVICGIRVEQIAEPLMQKVRWMDKLVDEAAKGKTMDKIFRVDVK